MATLTRIVVPVTLVLLGGLLVFPSRASAWRQYDQGCNNCHRFRGGGATLHTDHRNGATNNCGLCHMDGQNPSAPVYTSDSDASVAAPSGFGCVGCHGRDYGTAGSPQVEARGLRIRHAARGCDACHDLTDVPVGENVAPPYYGRADVTPVDPCNPNGLEEFLGDGNGLDNDGDDLYDQNDPDCSGSPCTATAAAAPASAAICEGTTLGLSDDGSAITCVTGNPVYEWWEGPANQPGSSMLGTGTSFDLPTGLAPGLHEYDFYVYCSDDPSCNDALDALIQVQVQALPGRVDDLRAAKGTVSLDDVAFSWTPAGDADFYRVYSVDAKVDLPPNMSNPRATERCTTPDGSTGSCTFAAAAPDPLHLYQAVGVCQSDTTNEGPN